MSLFRFLEKPIEDHRIELPGVTIIFNHRLKLAFVYCLDSDTADSAYDDIETHLKRRGYILKVIVAPIGLTVSNSGMVDSE